MKRIVLFSLVGLNACTEPETASFRGPAQPPMGEPVGFGGAAGAPVAIPVGGFAGNPLFTDPVVVADPPPPAISGGTLLVSSAGRWAAVSDPDRDQIVLVNIDEAKVTATIALEAGDEPGRLVEDGAGQLYVALRRGGAIATVDVAAGTLLERRAACAYPRGLAYDSASDSLHVACAEGLLVTMPAAGGEATRTVSLDRDLRDVVVENGRLWVSVFRSAEVLLLDAQGVVSERLRPPGLRPFASAHDDSGSGGSGFGPILPLEPRVAWRMVPDPAGGVLVLHQREQVDEIVIQPGGYTGGICGGIVSGGMTHFEPGEEPETSTMSFAAPLNVDVAVSPSGDEIILASAGAIGGQQLGAFQPSFPRFARSELGFSNIPDITGCAFTQSLLGTLTISGQPVAVAFDDSTPVVLLREPSMLVLGERALSLPGDPRPDSGHLLFHAATFAGLACASCHPEGREDSHTWSFQGFGQRRTQSIGGMLAGTAPFHWAGDEPTFDVLVNDVMTARMMGPVLTESHAAALHDWIDAIPPWETPAGDAAAIERGKVLFESETVACATCHAGEKFTDNKAYDVGTGAALQVPSLRGLVWRAPFLHNGCAGTVADRFGDCGGSLHGDVSGLTSTELGDLVAYLESL